MIILRHVMALSVQSKCISIFKFERLQSHFCCAQGLLRAADMLKEIGILPTKVFHEASDLLITAVIDRSIPYSIYRKGATMFSSKGIR